MARTADPTSKPCKSASHDADMHTAHVRYTLPLLAHLSPHNYTTSCMSELSVSMYICG
jgi:hypothetical protein